MLDKDGWMRRMRMKFNALGGVVLAFIYMSMAEPSLRHRRGVSSAAERRLTLSRDTEAARAINGPCPPDAVTPQPQAAYTPHHDASRCARPRSSDRGLRRRVAAQRRRSAHPQSGQRQPEWCGAARRRRPAHAICDIPALGPLARCRRGGIARVSDAAGSPGAYGRAVASIRVKHTSALMHVGLFGCAWPTPARATPPGA